MRFCYKKIYFCPIILLLPLLLHVNRASAQQGRVRLNKKIISVGEVMNAVERQSSYRFSYNRNDFDTARVHTFPQTDLSIADALNGITRNSGVKYVVRDRYIAFVPVKGSPKSSARSAGSGVSSYSSHPALRGGSPGRSAAPKRAPVADTVAQVTILFHFDSPVIDPDFMDNARNLRRLHEIMTDAEFMSKVDSIIIEGNASPEGSPAHNRDLAWRRTYAVKAYTLRNFPNLDISRVRAYALDGFWNDLLQIIKNRPDVPGQTELRMMIENPYLSDADRNARLNTMQGGRTFAYLRDNLILRSIRTGSIISFIYTPKEPAPQVRVEQRIERRTDPKTGQVIEQKIEQRIETKTNPETGRVVEIKSEPKTVFVTVTQVEPATGQIIVTEADPVAAVVTVTKTDPETGRVDVITEPIGEQLIIITEPETGKVIVTSEPVPELATVTTDPETGEVTVTAAETITEQVVVLVAEPETGRIIVAVSEPLPEPVVEPVVAPADTTEYKSVPVVALRTNLLLDVLGAVNLGVEIPLGKHFSVAADFAYSHTRINNLYALQGLQVTAEARYWFKPRKNALTGWNIGAYAAYGDRFDVQWVRGVQGNGYFSTGLSAGYSFRLADNFNLDLSAMGGFIYLPEMREYMGPSDGHLLWEKTRYNASRFYLTMVRVNLVWLINKKTEK